MRTQGKSEKGKGKAVEPIRDPRPACHAISGLSDKGRRRFMIGAAGLTFGVATGLPEMLAPGRAHAQAAAKQVVINPYVTLFTDGTVVIQSPAGDGPGIAHLAAAHRGRRNGRRLGEGKDRASISRRQALRESAVWRRAVHRGQRDRHRLLQQPAPVRRPGALRAGREYGAAL